MRNPYQRRRTRLVRRVLSHHGSDCSFDCRNPRANRCIILTRIDYLDSRPSVGWLSGDWAESRRYKAKYHIFTPTLPIWYGGQFWEHVQIDPPTQQDWSRA